jgi:kynurenine formamidase
MTGEEKPSVNPVRQGRVDGLLATLQAGIEIYDLGRPMFVGMPQSPDHAPYRLVIPRRHGDQVRADGSSGASEMIVTSSHVGTHIDALSHISCHGRLFGGVDARAACSSGIYTEHGAETIEPMISRGLLLDVPKALGLDRCPPAYEVTVEDLAAALQLTGTEPAPGDVILVRTGHGQLFSDPDYADVSRGAPGPSEEGARWLADFEPRAVGSDTIPFEHIPAQATEYILPAHGLLIVERGIYIIEVLDLERLAAERVYEFAFLLSPLKLVGATGSPVRPLALIAKTSGSGV